MFKENVHWRTWTGMALAALGIIVMLGEPDMMNHPQGVAIMLFSCACLAFSYVRMKHLQVVHPATYVCLINLFAAPIAFMASIVIAPDSWGNLGAVDWHVFGPLLAYQAVLVSSTHIIWQRLMHRGDVGKVTAFTLLIPFFTIILSVIILGEHISWAMIIGGLITMMGVGIITLRRIQKGIA
jgi:O-acetylserine/cysteine efflux transporter